MGYCCKNNKKAFIFFAAENRTELYVFFCLITLTPTNTMPALQKVDQFSDLALVHFLIARLAVHVLKQT